MFDHSPAGRNVRLGTQVRAMLAARVFKRCGKNVRIFHEVEFSFGYNLSVGDGVTIHRNVLIDDRGEVVLGNDVSISDYANIYSHSHAVEDIQDVTLGRTVIGDRARVTYHAVVLSGITVEADALVGSMGLASRSVPAGAIVNVAMLWASNGFRKSSWIATLDGAEDSTISMRPEPTLEFPVHS